MSTVKLSSGDDLVSVRRFASRRARTHLRILRRKVQATVDPQLPAQPPIFLVGCPRSGTSVLFDLLSRHPQLGSLRTEGHELWDAYNHASRHGYRSDALAAGDVHSRERRYVDRALAEIGGGGRALDKTPKNVMRIGYLRELYPEAHIVLLVRDGRAVVSSLLEGWKLRRGVSYRLPEALHLKDYRGRLWNYVLPVGWRELKRTDLASVCTRQYTASTVAAHEDLSRIDVTIRYEDLVAEPVEVMRGLLHGLGLPRAAVIDDLAARLNAHHVGSLSAPASEKWRGNIDQLRPHLPHIEEHMALFGYSS